MKTLERCQYRRSGVFIANSEYISHFVLIVNSGQANVCCIHIEKANTFENVILKIMLYLYYSILSVSKI